MTLLRPGRPNVKRVRRRHNLDGLRAALAYRREQVDYLGRTRDRGTGVRLDTLKALSGFDPAEATDHLLIAVEDPDP